ncbi:hypothetical protein CTI12_AA017360 [Artemisia annua]|uniref:Uncharacterized protein n=1 Tax=Artemisia annua TaxID=35608 RepID=A0A2U1Q898_ARTAN|nr:hypothetical protein CTI12_AA017360 [Artemisia annua]
MVRQQANSMVTHLLLPLPPPPPPIDDFMFDSTHTSPLNTAPSSPKNFASFHPNEDVQQEEEIDIDFAFDFSGQLVPPSISDADELFDCGKIKTLDPLPPQTRPKSPKFTQTFHRAKKDKTFTETFHRDQNKPKHKVSRSLSPIRTSNIKTNDQITTTQTSSLFGFTWHNKWNLKNLLLFRSTSAGSAEITKDVKNSSNNTSFRSVDGSVSGSSRRRMKRKVSAHEIHYTANRAVFEERRRKTMLPYKSGLLGCLGFGITMHEVSNRGY